MEPLDTQIEKIFPSPKYADSIEKSQIQLIQGILCDIINNNFWIEECVYFIL
jgi:hypothetical protein